MAALRASGIVKRFETTTALNGVDLSIEPGEVRGLLGPNGAGKSTLLRILLGLVRADAGSLELFNQPLEMAHMQRPASLAGFVESPAFYPYLSGRVNLELLVLLDRGRGGPSIDATLDRVALRPHAARRTNGYSSGMRQRLAIAGCLLQNPRVLLLDEPTSGMDPQGVRDVLALVRELSAEGVAVLVSSHQMSDVQDLCDTFTFLRTGRVVWDGTKAALRTQAHDAQYRMATSDDKRALQLGFECAGIRIRQGPVGELLIAGEQAELDAYVLRLGHSGVAVRLLEQLTDSVEAMFFELTGEGEGAPPPTSAKRGRTDERDARPGPHPAG